MVFGGAVILLVTFLAVAITLSGASQGTPLFVDVAGTMADPKANARGGCWADVDRDGDQDLFVTNTHGVSRLWTNEGGAGFADTSAHAFDAPVLSAVSCAFVDFDHDRYPDLFVSVNDRGQGGPSNRLFRNRGNGTFEDRSNRSGTAMPARGAASSDWADYDGDGDYDGFVATRLGKLRFRQNAMFESIGPFMFQDVSEVKGLSNPEGPQYTFLGSWFDYDVDGDPDVLLAIDYWGLELYRNDAGRFVRRTLADLPRATDNTPGAPPNNAMGVSWGDVDNDGCFDVFITGSNFFGQGGFGADILGDLASRLYRGQCDGSFEDVTVKVGLRPTGVIEWSANFVDFDNDGDLDLSVVAGNSGEVVNPRSRRGKKVITYVVSIPRRLISARAAAFLYRMEAMIPASGGFGKAAAMPNYLYKNMLMETGTLRLVEVTYQVGVGDMGSTQGSAWADFDSDGDLDWFVPNRGTPSRLFRNDGPVGNYLRVHLVGSPLRDAIGAWVKIRVGNRWQLRHVHVLDGYLSQSQLDPHFGLGAANTVDELWVRWPGSTTWKRACGRISANRMITVTQAGACR